MKRASVNKLNLGLTYVNTTAGFSRAIIELRKNKGRFFSREKIFEKIKYNCRKNSKPKNIVNFEKK